MSSSNDPNIIKHSPSHNGEKHRRDSQLYSLVSEQLNLQRKIDSIQREKQNLLEQQRSLELQANELLKKNSEPGSSYTSSPLHTSPLAQKYSMLPTEQSYTQHRKSTQRSRESSFSLNGNQEEMLNITSSTITHGQSMAIEETQNISETGYSNSLQNNMQQVVATFPSSKNAQFGDLASVKSFESITPGNISSANRQFFTPTTSPFMFDISNDIRKEENIQNLHSAYQNFQPTSTLPPTAPVRFPIPSLKVQSDLDTLASKYNIEETPTISEGIEYFKRQQFTKPTTSLQTSQYWNKSKRPSILSDNDLDIDTQFQYPSYIQQQGTGPSRKALFTPYIPQEDVPSLLKEGKLISGIVRVNKKNRSDAWVSTEGVLDSDIYICGSKDRNRALEGDIVAVELLPVNEVWESKKEKEEKKRRKEANFQQLKVPLNSTDDYHNDASLILTPTNSMKISNDDELSSFSELGLSESKIKKPLRRENSLKQRPTSKKNDDLEVEGRSLLLVEEEEINNEFRPLYAGHIVAILDRIPGQLFSGLISILRPSQQTNENRVKKSRSMNQPKIVWFKPTDKKVPLIAIPTELAPRDFVQNHKHYENQLFVASIKRWPITSLHPFGVIVSELGAINDSRIELDAILRDNKFPCNEYDDCDTNRESKYFNIENIPADLLQNRVDFTNINTYKVLAIAENNNMSQFAIHIKNNRDGTLEFACHVLDVTLYIEEDTPLDKRARKRSTSIIMPQHVVHLLPKTINQAICFYNNKISPAISIIFNLDKDTLSIKSYNILESNIKPTLMLTDNDISGDLANTEPNPYLSMLAEIARCFYADRLNDKSLKLVPSLTLIDCLDDEKHKPDLNIFNRTIGSLIVEEIQRKVNVIVAECIYQQIGSTAFLRRQLAPTPRKLTSFIKKVERFGYTIDTTSPDTIIKSILSINDTTIRKGVELCFFKILNRPKNFILEGTTQMQIGYFSTNLSLYTNFTSPLNRYGDHIVHRQLRSIIRNKSYSSDGKILKMIAEYCNFKKDCAYQAQHQAMHLLLSKCIKNMSGEFEQILTMGTVLQVYESSFDIFIPEFGLEKRVHCDQLPLIKVEFDESKRQLYMYWKQHIDSSTYVSGDEKDTAEDVIPSFDVEDIALDQVKRLKKEGTLLTEDMSKYLKEVGCKEPTLNFPSNFFQTDNISNNILEQYRETTIIKTEHNYRIQIISELQTIPILLRAEFGMTLPCISIRAFNPFYKRDLSA